MWIRLFVFAIFVGLAPPVFSQEVHLVQSQDIASYREVVAGFKNVYTTPFALHDLKGNPSEFDRVKKQFSQNDLIVTVGLLATTLVQDEADRVPIKGPVFSMLFDSTQIALLNEVSTGVSSEVPPSELFSKIKQLFPKAKKIGVLYDPKKK